MSDCEIRDLLAALSGEQLFEIERRVKLDIVRMRLCPYFFILKTLAMFFALLYFLPDMLIVYPIALGGSLAINLIFAFMSPNTLI